MPFVPCANTALVEVRGTYHGSKIEVTLYFEHAAGYDTEALATLAAGVAGWWHTDVMNNLSADYVYRETFATDLTSADGATATDTTNSGSLGSVAGEGLPSSIAACITFRTAHRGRSFHGRNYIPGLPANAVFQDRLSGPFMTNLLTIYNRLLTLLPGFTWCVVSRFSGHTIVNGEKVPTPRAAGVITPVTTAAWADDVVDNQRRRLEGRGQ